MSVRSVDLPFSLVASKSFCQ